MTTGAPPGRPHRRGRRILAAVLLVLVGVLLGLYVGLPVGMAVVATWPAPTEVGEPPDGFRTVAFTTTDGVGLAGWYAPPGDGTAVLVVHGAGGSRATMRPIAERLAGAGFGVLALDLRGHGESEGRTNRFGWQGTTDLTAAVRFLMDQEGVERLAGLGSSLGGEALLGASDVNPELRAIVADGATRRSTEELRALPSERPLVRNFTARVMFAAVGLLTGERPPAPLLNAMQASEGTRFLLIAAGEDAQEVAFNEHFAATLGERATLWVVPGVGHTGAFEQDPDAYLRRVTEFLQRHLAD